jgi:hypothetical protein
VNSAQRDMVRLITHWAPYHNKSPTLSHEPARIVECPVRGLLCFCCAMILSAEGQEASERPEDVILKESQARRAFAERAPTFFWSASSDTWSQPSFSESEQIAREAHCTVLEQGPSRAACVRRDHALVPPGQGRVQAVREDRLAQPERELLSAVEHALRAGGSLMSDLGGSHAFDGILSVMP